MTQNITLMGASYPDVPAVTLPKTGGGTAEFTDVSDTTAAAADVAAGKFFYTALGVKTQGTASGGGGGASNIVTGTFKGTTTGAAMDVNLSYSGSGYPIAVLVFPDTGVTAGTFGSTIQRYAIEILSVVKKDTSYVPDYSNTSGDKNNATTLARYKSSTSNAGSYSNSSGSNVYGNTDAESSTVAVVLKVKSATKMSVYIASNSYGFMANIDYRYVVLYSS